MSLAEALRQAYPGILIGPTKTEGEVILCAGRIAHWGRPESQPLEADVLAAYDPLIDSKAARIAAINAECTRRILAVWPLEKQVSVLAGIYGQAQKDAVTVLLAAHVDASNAASDSVTAATTVQAVEAVTVSWPA